MGKVHTHYDNLKVMRNAPPEVVLAAYRGLSQKYHPDRNQGDAESARIMTILNAAKQVLSDPAKRAAYDREIQEEEAAVAARSSAARTEPDAGASSSTGSTSDGSRYRKPPESQSSRASEGHSGHDACSPARTSSSANSPDSNSESVNSNKTPILTVLAIFALFAALFVAGKVQGRHGDRVVQSPEPTRAAVVEERETSASSELPQVVVNADPVSPSDDRAAALERDAIAYYEKARSVLENAQELSGYLTAKTYFEKSYALGNLQAGYELGYLHEMAMVGDASPDKAIVYYEAAAKIGNSNAAYRLGVMYSTRLSSHFDPKKAERHLSRAKQLGHYDAERRLVELKASMGRID